MQIKSELQSIDCVDCSTHNGVAFKAPCAYKSPLAIYIGLEPLSAQKFKRGL